MECSVLTSSSTRPLRQFVSELVNTTNCKRIDLLAFRDSDLRQIVDIIPTHHPKSGCWPVSTESILGIPSSKLRDETTQNIAEWIRTQLQGRVRIAAFATYFPSISANIGFLESLKATSQITRRHEAVDSIAATVEIGAHLRNMGLLEHVFIEVVGGPLFDRASAPDEDHEYLVTSALPRKIKFFTDALYDVSKQLGNNRDWTICVELEPDPIFVFHSLTSLRLLKAQLTAYPELKDRVALNLDIAHMTIAGISASTLKEFAGFIGHCHISDHPHIHTRDRCPGTWSFLEHWRSEVYQYLSVFSDSRNQGLQNSGSLTLELEGCSKFSWVMEGVSRIEYALKMFDRWKKEIAEQF